ncbi:MAG: thermonuclease family protein [Ilumatobacteraceae bacterium]
MVPGGRTARSWTAVLLTACSATVPGSTAGSAVVVGVVDGDTIDVTIGGRTERVRLLGIDTPEIDHDAFDGRPAVAAECFGDEATAHVGRLLPPGSAVRLVRDVVGRDDYGRLLAFVFRSSDGLFVNEHLVRTGFAVPLSIPPNESLRSIFVDAARAAERDDAGLWGAC